MIVYISSYRYKAIIEKAVTESGQAVLDSAVEERLEFRKYIKGQVNQYRLVTTLVVDLTCLADSETELAQAFSDFRLLFDEAQVIAFAPGREAGDTLLASLFQMGIYDLLVGGEDELEQGLRESLARRRSYRDSLGFRGEAASTGGAGEVKEKIIIQNSILPTFRKITVGVLGAQGRIGTTHITIWMACFLAAQGYRVAAVECAGNPAYPAIADSYEEVEQAAFGFRLQGVDFYPGRSPDGIAQIQQEDYHFILIDFGEAQPGRKADYGKCVRLAAVSGTRAWELDHIFKVFELFGEERQRLDYIFNLADPGLEEGIRSNMEGLPVYFSGFHPDCFRVSEDGQQEWMKGLFAEYLPQITRVETGKGQPWWKKIKGRIKRGAGGMSSS